MLKGTLEARILTRRLADLTIRIAHDEESGTRRLGADPNCQFAAETAARTFA